MNYYEILGVSPEASDSEIKSAYREKVKKLHPDVNSSSNSEEEIKRLNEAYNTLKNKDSKAAYDRQFQNDQNPFTNFNDIFSQMFGFGANAQVITSVNVAIDILEAFNGCKKSISFNGKQIELEIPEGVHNGDRFELNVDGAKLLVIVVIRNSENFRINGSEILMTHPVSVLDILSRKEIRLTNPLGEEIIINNIPNKSLMSGEIVSIPNKGMKGFDGSRGNLLVSLIFIVPELTEEQLKNKQIILDIN